jgi:hypothetical protein
MNRDLNPVSPAQAWDTDSCRVTRTGSVSPRYGRAAARRRPPERSFQAETRAASLAPNRDREA